MKVRDDVRNFLATQPETGMGYHMIVGNLQGETSYFAVFNGIRAFEFNDDLLNLQDIEDDLGDEVRIQNFQMMTSSIFSSFRLRGKIDPTYGGGTGSFPLIKKYKLPVATKFYRNIAHGPNDFRYNSTNSELSKGTYLTTELDKNYTNSGFAAVGRFALPIPLPANYCIQYELPKGTVIKAGTVAPNFGQAGGGVEVVLLNDTPGVTMNGVHILSDF